MEGFTLTFEFPPDKGPSVEGVADALHGMQDAVRRMVEHLAHHLPPQHPTTVTVNRARDGLPTGLPFRAPCGLPALVPDL